MQNNDIPELTREKLNKKLTEGYKDFLAGRTIPFDEAMKNIRKELNLDSKELNKKEDA